MKLLIGLGNPGAKYQNTWHNLGFAVLEDFGRTVDCSRFKASAKFNAEIAESKVEKEKIILAKPQSFMNLSGEVVGRLAKYYKLPPDDIIVIHDDLDLPLGKIRVAFDSSAGGHNGVKSIIETLGSQKFLRLKIGVKTDRLAKMNAADYVLAKISAADKKILKPAIKKAVAALTTALAHGYEQAMNDCN